MFGLFCLHPPMATRNIQGTQICVMLWVALIVSICRSARVTSTPRILKSMMRHEYVPHSLGGPACGKPERTGLLLP